MVVTNNISIVLASTAVTSDVEEAVDFALGKMFLP